MSQWDFSGPPPAWQRGEYDEYGEFVPADGSEPGAFSDDFEGGTFSPISYERDPYPSEMAAWPYDRAAYAEPSGDTAMLRPPGAVGAQEAPGAPGSLGPPGGQGARGARPLSRPAWLDESFPPRAPRRRGRPRWFLTSALVAVAVAAGATGASVLLLANGHSAQAPGASGTSAAPGGAGAAPSATSTRTAPASPGAGAAQPVTMAQARQILARYTTANNKANAAMSDALLASVESGSSYAIDAGIYRVQRAEKAAPYPAFSPEQTRIYIPGQAAGAYPHWFVAQVVNAELATPGKLDGTEYVVFTQAAPGAPWRNAVEPYVVGGGATPQVALGADGLAIGVSDGQTSLAVSPASIASLTAASLDGTKGGIAVPGNPGNLADRLDQAFWRHRLPAATVLDRHAPSHGPVFGLATTDGGALLFYTDTAKLTLIPPAGEALHLTIPGFFSSGQSLNKAEIGYMEQFATYVPPRGGSGLRVVADYSGITAR